MNSNETFETRKISPPKLHDANLHDHIVCHRPVRSNSPNLTVCKIQAADNRQEIFVANNYGHGGSGWTLAPAAAEYVNNLLFEKIGCDNKKLPVTIVGGGVIGLFTAYDLLSKGFQKVTILGGLIAPVSMDNSEDGQKLVNKLALDAYKFYSSIARGLNADFGPDLVDYLSIYFSDRSVFGLEPYVTAGLIAPAQDVTLDFGNGTKRNMVEYRDGLLVQPHKIINQLTSVLQRNRIKFVKAHIQSLSSIEGASVIINCAGISGPGFVESKDSETMTSFQGHLISLKGQTLSELQYMIVSPMPEGFTKSGHHAKRMCYFFPKIFNQTANVDEDCGVVGVIGGTFIQGATDETPNHEEFKILVDNARKYFGV